MNNPNFLEYRQYRYLKVAGLLVVFAALAYAMYTLAEGGSYGGTWLGYGLGTLSAVMVLFLAWYGVRKRRTPIQLERRRADPRRPLANPGAVRDHRSEGARRKRPHGTLGLFGGTLQEWLSAHVYLGLAVLAVASLHAGFRFDWNVHGLAYGLLVLVVASGCYGTFAYIRLPRILSDNIGDDTLTGLLRKMAELDEQARERASGLPDEVRTLVSKACLETQIAGTLFPRLASGRAGCATEQVVERVQQLGNELISGDQPRQLRDLYLVLLQKQRLLRKARAHLRLERRMRLWLYVHTPLSIGLVAAIFVHVVTILVYW